MKKNRFLSLFISFLSGVCLVFLCFSQFRIEANEWMLEQISEDLAYYREQGGISKEKIKLLADGKECVIEDSVKFNIKNNNVSMSGIFAPFNKHRADAIKEALEEICRIYWVPDVEFIVFLKDEFNIELDAPIFLMSKNRYNKREILIPDFEALSGNVEFHKEVNKGIQLFPWEKKTNKVIWRGAMTGGEFTQENFLEFPRTKVISLSHQFPELINAGFNKLTQCTDCFEIKLKYPRYFTRTVPVSHQIKFKYQINIDGNSCAFSSFYWKLFSNCVVFKQSSDEIQWFYRALQPYVHYIPVQSDLSDLIDKIQWAVHHDEEAKMISHEAQAFAHINLSRKYVLDYFYLLIKEYAKLIK